MLKRIRQVVPSTLVVGDRKRSQEGGNKKKNKAH